MSAITWNRSTIEARHSHNHVTRGRRCNMHAIIFYPVNNGDSCQIILDNAKRILLDYRQHPNATDTNSPEIDLATTLRDSLKDTERDYFDVVAFTHADKDHIEGCTEFFELIHAKKYQGSERIKIDELWVPAAILLEVPERDEQSEEFAILRREAWCRLKYDKGIKIFSKPDELLDQMKQKGINIEDRQHIFVDAGEFVETFTIDNDEVEFFCHAPFIKHAEGGVKEVRNQAGLVFNIRFKAGENFCDVFANGDPKWEVLEDIVEITQHNQNDDRLRWDLFCIPHHCSYLSLSDEKGDKETLAKERVKELLLSGNKEGYMICSSNPIPDKSAGYEQTQPPHIQARNCYEKHLKEIGGREFLVTMEEPSEEKPKPIEIEIDEKGHRIKKRLSASAASFLTTTKPPRVG